MTRNTRHHDIFPMTLREITVTHVDDITPGMRRITFTSTQFNAHHQGDDHIPPLVSTGFDDDVRLIFPHPDTGDRPAPRSLGNGRLEWTADINELFRTYTIRRWKPDKGEIDIDFVRHGAGLADTWSQTATPGDSIYMVGPKNCGGLPEGVDWILLAGDDTALPAIGRCLESYPSLHAVAFIEVTTPERIQKLDIPSPNVELHWVVRSNGDTLDEALAAFTWPEGTPYVWCAGEASQLRRIRTLIKEQGVKPEHTQITGYWRDGQPSPHPGASMVAATTRLATMANIAPAFAVRAAADAGIFTAIDDGVTTPGPLADITGFARSRLVRFMRYLAAMNLVTIGNESSGSSQRTSSDNNNNQTTVDHATPEGQLVYGLTPLGMELADPHSPASGYLSGFGAMQALSFIHLGEGLRTGKPVGLGADGRTLAHCTNTNPGLAHGLAAGANLRMGWLAPAVATGLDLSGTSTAMVIGPGAAVLADELTRTNPSLTVTIVDHPDRKQLNLAEISDTRRPRISTAESISDADVVIIHDPWGEDIPTPEVDDSASRAHLTNGAPGSVASDGADPAGDAPAVFSALPDSVSTVVVVTQILLDDGTGDNADYEADLQRMLVSGTSIPTERDVHTALCNAGFVIENRQPVGWGPIRFIARRVG